MDLDAEYGHRWCLCLGAQAQALDYKIGVVDPERVIEESPQYEAARQALHEEVADRERALREQQAKLEELKKNLERDAPLMSEEETRQAPE